MNKKSANNSLIIVAVAFVFLVFAYIFGFNKMNTKSDDIQTEIDSLDKTIQKRTEYKNNKQVYESGMEKYDAEKEVYLSCFKSDLNTEDVLNLIYNMYDFTNEDGSDVVVSIKSVTIGNPIEAYSADGSDLKGFVASISVDYEYASYDSLKSMIYYINSYDSRCNVTTYSATYTELETVSEETGGLLQGTIAFNMYYIQGDGYENYELPEAASVYEFSTTDPFTPGDNTEVFYY